MSRALSFTAGPTGLLLLLAASALAQPPASDTPLEGAELARFERTGGLSHVGKDVTFRMSVRALRKPWKRSRRALVFRYSGVPVVVSRKSRDLARVRRKGGEARLRGQVVRLRPPEDDPEAPKAAIVVRELRPRR